jgi:DNA-binding transcriptional LysR family regulator
MDAGLGRVRIEDPAIRREILYEEPLVAALSSSDRLARETEPVELEALIRRPLIIYPSQPRPSYADQVLTLLSDHGCTPGRVTEVREVQTALGLVAAESGVAIVPALMQHIQRRDVHYAPIRLSPTSPVILSQRHADSSLEAKIIRRIGLALFSDARAPNDRSPNRPLSGANGRFT